MVNTDLQRQQFEGRLQRIKRGGPNTLGQVYVGPAHETARGAGTAHRSSPFKIILGILAGGLAYLLGNLGQFHLMNRAGELVSERLGETGMVMLSGAGDMLFACLVLIVLARIFRLRGLGPALAGLVGLFGMMGGHTLAITTAPEVYAALYSPSYVEQQIAISRPLSAR